MHVSMKVAAKRGEVGWNWGSTRVHLAFTIIILTCGTAERGRNIPC